jgi:hypothetical protein
VTVEQLRAALAAMPGHWPVHVAVNSDHDHGRGIDTDYLFTLDCVRSAFPSQGNMAVITINYEPT